MEKNREYSNILLEPFAHQVGGHSTIQQFDKYTVCKPLFSKELRFYQDVSAQFKPFIPEFKGVVSIRHADVKENGKYLCEMTDSAEHVKLHTYRYGKHCASCTCHRKIVNLENCQLHYNTYQNGQSEHPDCPSMYGNTERHDDSAIKYLLLENVVGYYKFPCILDLKMGTEKHRDYIVSKEEANRRQARWDQTTSKSLGARLCGMKVYHVTEGSFVMTGDGRSLTVSGFKEAIRTFLFNGRQSRYDVIEPYLTTLRELLHVMERQSTYLFYNTSLLLIYEGDTSKGNHVVAAGNRDGGDIQNRGSRASVGVRMIDFAHVHCYSDNSSLDLPVEGVLDEGYLIGLRSVICIFEEILHELG